MRIHGQASRQHLSDIDDAFRFVLRWFCGLDDDGNKAASYYYRHVNPYLKKGGDPADLRKSIKAAGSLAKFRKMHTPGASSGRPNKGHAPASLSRGAAKTGQVSEHSDDDDLSDGGDGSLSPLIVELEIAPEDRQNLLESHLPRFMTFKLKLVRRLTSGGIVASLLSFTDRDPYPPDDA